MSRYYPLVTKTLAMPLLAAWLHASDLHVSTKSMPPERGVNIIDTSGERLGLKEVNITVSDEDRLIILALEALDKKDYKAAHTYFTELYTKTHNREYLIELCKLNVQLRRSTETVMLADDYLKKHPKDIEVRKYLVNALLAKKKLLRAKHEALKVASMTKSAKDYEMVGDIFQMAGDNEGALKYYKQSYSLKADEGLIDKIASVLYMMGRGNEAAGYYETHIRIYGCSKYLCQRLAELYADLGDIENVITISRRLYERYKEADVANRIIQLYLLRNNLDGLIEFLKKNKFDNLILLEAYKAKRDFKNAAAIALKLYQKNGDPDFLGQATIYRFEEESSPSPALLNETVRNLRQVISTVDSDIYLNYLGYLLIDYDIDIQEGIELVKRAVAKNPSNEAYLDSLAWGYYKLGRCKEAYEQMKKVIDAMPEDKVVKEHWEAIKKCYDRTIDPKKTLRGLLNDTQ
ncbi:MAG: hypothetical protein K6347_01430 [Campylobacterales bacterium]